MNENNKKLPDVGDYVKIIFKNGAVVEGYVISVDQIDKNSTFKILPVQPQDRFLSVSIGDNFTIIQKSAGLA